MASTDKGFKFEIGPVYTILVILQVKRTNTIETMINCIKINKISYEYVVTYLCV